MFKLILVVTTCVIAGCDNLIHYTTHDQLEKICEGNGGYAHAYVDPVTYRAKIVCKNGFRKSMVIQSPTEINKQMESEE